MSDTPCCYIGGRADAEAINSALASTRPLREVARSFGVSRPVLRKHLLCLGITERKTSWVVPPRPSPLPRVAKSETIERIVPTKPEKTPVTTAGAAVAPQGSHVDQFAPVAVTEEEQVAYLASLIQHNRYHSYRTLSWLERVWKLDRDTVRARFAAAVEKCAADRAQEIAQKEVALAALEMQETLALREFRRLRMDNPTAARAYLALAMKARTEYADLAGLKTIKSEVNINVWQRTEFVLAVDRFTDAALDVVAPVDPLPLLTRLKDRLAQVGVAPQVVAAAPEVLEAALALLQQDMQARFSEAASGSEVAQLPAVVEGTGQDVQAAE